MANPITVPFDVQRAIAREDPLVCGRTPPTHAAEVPRPCGRPARFWCAGCRSYRCSATSCSVDGACIVCRTPLRSFGSIRLQARGQQL